MSRLPAERSRRNSFFKHANQQRPKAQRNRVQKDISPRPDAETLAGLIHHTPASIATTKTPGITESHVPVAARAPAPAHPFEDNASANVATRDEVWRRRKRLRLAWARNQY